MKGSVRDQIVDAASRLFYEQGYNATGINQIIAEAGVAKASLYQHFPSKEDLLAEYLSNESERAMTKLHQEVSNHDTVQKKSPLYLIPWDEASGNLVSADAISLISSLKFPSITPAYETLFKNKK